MPCEKVLRIGEVAAIFRVDRRTVARWADAGKIQSMLTPGGHRRFRHTDVVEALQRLRERFPAAMQPHDGIGDSDIQPNH